ncbi:hypothetical protein JYU34_011038 [Plutella xylostella]|uniref:Uncharacterized protein n=1 Tax=Plutella xylostella TaxID=51655 RepID=A0ABQ7QFW5_PLUXY|nr:hypothetical protein JYU34_011038 [Plutella xylostella]
MTHSVQSLVTVVEVVSGQPCWERCRVAGATQLEPRAPAPVERDRLPGARPTVAALLVFHQLGTLLDVERPCHYTARAMTRSCCTLGINYTN